MSGAGGGRRGSKGARGPMLCLWGLGALLALPACSTVQSVQVRPDYEQVDRVQTVRVAVLTAPLPANNASLARMWSLMAQRYANLHRDFLAQPATVAVALPASATPGTDHCDAPVQGVLHLIPGTRLVGSDVELSVTATLSRCRDGEVIWSARGAGTWASEDKELVEVSRRYIAELGPSVAPYVAPTFRLLRDVLGTLPKPKLTRDKDVTDKIELE